ncbi:MAG: hypothetical protein IPM35_23625 [Myxococcales bacterium]|nr:hypothetical protein [Myxococcales bacterium]
MGSAHAFVSVGLGLIGGSLLCGDALAADAPKVVVQSVQTEATPKANASIKAVITGQNAGTLKSGHHPVSVLWCSRADKPFKDAAGKWTVLPTIGNCSQAIMSTVRFNPLEPSATEQLTVDVTVPTDSCQKALVVKYGQGKNDFTDPNIAKYVPVFVGLKEKEAALTGNIAIEVVKKKKKKTKDRIITVSYTLEGGVFNKNRIDVQLCNGNRCWLKHSEAIPADARKKWKEKVGTAWVWKEQAKSSFQVKHSMDAVDFYPGLPKEVRVSYAQDVPTHEILERKCEDAKLVLYKAMPQ